MTFGTTSEAIQHTPEFLTLVPWAHVNEVHRRAQHTAWHSVSVTHRVELCVVVYLGASHEYWAKLLGLELPTHARFFAQHCVSQALAEPGVAFISQ